MTASASLSAFRSPLSAPLVGGKHRYHIESTLSCGEEGTVYKAFTRRKVGNRIVRRYYAVIQRGDNASPFDFDSTLMASAMTLPYEVFEVERFEQEDRAYVVLAKGKSPRQPNPRWQSVQNRGYLMLLLAALILILMIVRFFRSSDESTVTYNDNTPAVEKVEAEQ